LRWVRHCLVRTRVASTTRFRSLSEEVATLVQGFRQQVGEILGHVVPAENQLIRAVDGRRRSVHAAYEPVRDEARLVRGVHAPTPDRKSTRLNSSHQIISYAVLR